MQLHPLGIVFGLAGSFLAMAVVTLLGWLALALLGAEDPATTAAIAGAPVGAVAGGWVAGRTAVRSVFHGALTGVLFAGIVMVLSILDGSPAPFGTLLGFVVGGAVLGGLGGLLALRRRAGIRHDTVD